MLLAVKQIRNPKYREFKHFAQGHKKMAESEFVPK